MLRQFQMLLHFIYRVTMLIHDTNTDYMVHFSSSAFSVSVSRSLFTSLRYCLVYVWCGVVLCGFFGSHPVYTHWPTEWMEVNYRRTNGRTNKCEERNKLIKLMLNEMRTSKRWNEIILFLSNHTKKVCVCASKIHRIQTSDVDVFAFSFCSAQLHLTIANTAATATTATASAENDSDSKRYSVCLIVLPMSRL